MDNLKSYYSKHTEKILSATKTELKENCFFKLALEARPKILAPVVEADEEDQESTNQESKSDICKCSSGPRIYLLEMIPDLISSLQNPSSILNNTSMYQILKKLYHQKGYAGDVTMFLCFVNLMTALKLAAENHPHEARDLMERHDMLERMLSKCMSADSMDNQDKVMAILSNVCNQEDKKFKNNSFGKAKTFMKGAIYLFLLTQNTFSISLLSIRFFLSNFFYMPCINFAYILLLL